MFRVGRLIFSRRVKIQPSTSIVNSKSFGTFSYNSSKSPLNVSKMTSSPSTAAVSSDSSNTFLEKFVNDHSAPMTCEREVYQVIVLAASADNFMYLLKDKRSKHAFAVDPLEPEKLMAHVERQGLTLKGVLTTHHHWDHSGGNEQLVELVKKKGLGQLPVYGGDDRIPALTNKVEDGTKLKLGHLTIRCIATPCHTTGHICYFLEQGPENDNPIVFTGDTLFVGGCGKFFEGTAQQMYDALIGKLSKLPDQTDVFCGHEYTINNLTFGLSIEPNNAWIKQKLLSAEEDRRNNLRCPTVPSSIELEKVINPFMRVEMPEMQQRVDATNAVECMRILREMKNSFKP